MRYYLQALGKTCHCHEIGDWVNCDFMSFSAVFQSYQDDVMVIMKGCMQWNPVYIG